MDGALVDRERRDDSAAGDLREPMRLQRIRPAHQDRGRRRRGRREGRRREVAAELFEHQPEREIAERRAAMRFGDDDARQAHFAKRRPGGGIIPLGRRRRAHLAERADGRLLVGPFAHHVAEHRLFVVEYGHRAIPSSEWKTGEDGFSHPSPRPSPARRASHAAAYPCITGDRASRGCASKSRCSGSRSIRHRSTRPCPTARCASASARPR